MKTDIDIKDDIYGVLEGTPIHQEVTGNLCKQGRETDLEDICISVLSNQNGEEQMAVVNVNISTTGGAGCLQASRQRPLKEATERHGDSSWTRSTSRL